ncbi:MAG: hypothetical protein CHACPFDD_02982 [Phycisphaerae bacterium]|nr:hypothetical protein [Phycisphaerae bacterium]
MKRARLGLLFLLGLMPTVALADDVIKIRLSVKVILRRDGTDPPDLDVSITAMINAVNTRFEQYGRGYRLELVSAGTRIGGGFDTERPNPSHYFATNIVADPVERSNMEFDAVNNPALWAWDFNAVNMYIHEPTSGLECTRPESDIIVIGDGDTFRSNIYVHLLGHYFGLCNSQGCGCNCCGECNEPTSDGIADTLPDLSCWDQDEIALHNFGTTYDNLTAEQQGQVDEAIQNAMSYRGTSATFCGTGFPGLHLTEGQLDRWADMASTTHLGVCDGRTMFVQAGASGTQTGRSTAPFDRVAEGVAAANGGGDIVLIRNGVYHENLTISVPVTLRTPRDQTARIGG